MRCFKCHKKISRTHGIRFWNQWDQLVVLHKKCKKELDNKVYNIILEGCDGVGKSSIYEELMHKGLFGKPMIGIQHKHKFPPKSYEDGYEINREILYESNRFNGLVFDRHILSERVYAPILRNYIAGYTHDLEKQLESHNYLFLITAELEVVKKRFDGKDITLAQLPRILASYQFHFNTCKYPNKYIIDTTNITPTQALEKIEELITKHETN